MADPKNPEPEETKKPGLFRRLLNGIGWGAKKASDALFWFSEEETDSVNPEKLSQTIFGNFKKEFTEFYALYTG